jgi:hypothetical protein
MFSIYHKISILIICVLVVSCTPKTYYGVDGYGKFEFYKENMFCYDFFDTGKDTGTYHILNDTIILNSKMKPLEMETNLFENERETILILGEIISDNGCLKNKVFLNLDLLTDEVILNDIMLEKGDVLKIDFLNINQFNFFSKSDTLLNDILVKMDLTDKRKIYFNDFKLLKINNYLTPINSTRKEFEKTNNIEFEILKKGKKNQKYKVYFSGGFIY